MRCTGYCTASSYDIPKLFQFLLTKGPIQLFRDVIHIEFKKDKKSKGDVFYFSYGVIVCWGLTPAEEKNFLAYAKEFEKEPNKKIEIDEFSYLYGETMNIEEDEIVLHNKSILTKLAVSHGIAQSIKLTIFEDLIQQTIGLTKDLPADLASKGKISLSKKGISKKMGELFMRRSFINLHLEILDVPEFFWNYPELEPFYRKSAHYLDVSKRGDILNKRLGVIHELFEILSGELNHQHSARLEWIIIVLIVMEVILAVLNDVFNLWNRHG
jgi:uncharacterized Rmd1/YagE family protein